MSDHHADNDLCRLIQEAFEGIEPSQRVYRALRARLSPSPRPRRVPLFHYEASRIVSVAAVMLLVSLFLVFAPRQRSQMAPQTASSPVPVALTPDREAEPLGAWSQFHFMAELR